MDLLQFLPMQQVLEAKRQQQHAVSLKELFDRKSCPTAGQGHHTNHNTLHHMLRTETLFDIATPLQRSATPEAQQNLARHLVRQAPTNLDACLLGRCHAWKPPCTTRAAPPKGKNPYNTHTGKPMQGKPTHAVTIPCAPKPHSCAQPCNQSLSVNSF